MEEGDLATVQRRAKIALEVLGKVAGLKEDVSGKAYVISSPSDGTKSSSTTTVQGSLIRKIFLGD